MKRPNSHWLEAARSAAERLKPALFTARRITSGAARLCRSAVARLKAVRLRPARLTFGCSKSGAARLVRSAYAGLKNFRFEPSRMMPVRLSPIGIDVGTRVIKAAQLARVGGAWRLHAEAILPRNWDAEPARRDDAKTNQTTPKVPAAARWAVDDATVTRLLDVLERRGFSGRRVVLSSPPAVLQSDLLDLPPRSSGAPLEQIARSEMARSSSLQGTPFEMECWDLPAAARANSGTSVLAVAVRHADAEALIDPFERQGADVVALDSASWALARALGRSAAEPGCIVAVADLGFSGASLVLLGEASVLYQRHLPEAGVASLYRTVMDRYDASEEVARRLLTEAPASDDSARATWIAQLVANYIEHLIDELQVSFAFSSHRYPELPLKRLLLTGGGASLWRLAETLRAGLSVEVAVPGARELVEVPERLSACAASPALSTAIGLAAYGQALGAGGTR
jgi:Tfp pilus assembly PilM family ATPase